MASDAGEAEIGGKDFHVDTLRHGHGLAWRMAALPRSRLSACHRIDEAIAVIALQEPTVPSA
jgi:hypothetical protein